MIVSRFLLWARRAPPGDRADAVTALANAFLYSDLSHEDRWEAETALTAMLDDPSVLVRQALAEALGASPDAPRHLVVALAGDASDVAAAVLSRSPLLADGDLVDCAALGDERLQSAIAGRRPVSAPVAAALAEIGMPGALVVLARNQHATIADFSLARMIERHGSHALVREALLVRPDLPVEIAQAIAAAIAADLGRFVSACGWLSPERSGRVTREASERTAIALSARSDPDGAGRLVEFLTRSGGLTPALLLRSLLSGRVGLVEAAFADLSGLHAARVSAILHDRSGTAFRALYGRAGLPGSLRGAFEAALGALQEGCADERPPEARLSRRVVARALAACEAQADAESGRVVALLRRFEAEAALDDARRAAEGLADRAALAVVGAHAPATHGLEAERRDRFAA